MVESPIWSAAWGEDPAGKVESLLRKASAEWLRHNARPVSYSMMDAIFVYAAEALFWEVAGPPERPSGQAPLSSLSVPEVADGEAVVYRHWGGSTLLYVGYSTHFQRRQRGHRASSHWWPEITFIGVEPYDTPAAALAAEKDAITTDRPLYNVAGTSARMLAR